MLVAPAGRYFMNSTFASLPWHVGQAWAAAVHLHPDDAEARGLADGSRGAGAQRPRLVPGGLRGRRRDPAGPGVHLQGVLGAAEPRRQNVNAVTACATRTSAAGPTFHDTRVEVEAVPAELLEPPPDTVAAAGD